VSGLIFLDIIQWITVVVLMISVDMNLSLVVVNYWPAFVIKLLVENGSGIWVMGTKKLI